MLRIPLCEDPTLVRHADRLGQSSLYSFTSIQMIALGILIEYLGRLVVDRTLNLDADPTDVRPGANRVASVAR